MVNFRRLLDNFFEYIRTDSETFHEKRMCARLAQDLGSLGMHVRTDHAGTRIGSDGYNIYVSLDGDASLDPILLSAHMDTVPPGRH